MKVCEVCGTSEGRICGKSGKYGMDLCNTHRQQIQRHGNIFEYKNKRRKQHECNEILIIDDYAQMIVCNNNGDIYKCKLDINDIPTIKEYKWCIGNTFNLHPAIVATINNKVVNIQKILIHTNNEIIYKNKDTLDFRRCNLIEATKSQKLQNSKIKSNNTSGYKGVSWNKNANKWSAQIKVDKQIHLGYFADIQDAIAARKAAEEKYFGDFAYDESRDVTLNKRRNNNENH